MVVHKESRLTEERTLVLQDSSYLWLHQRKIASRKQHRDAVISCWLLTHVFLSVTPLGMNYVKHHLSERQLCWHHPQLKWQPAKTEYSKMHLWPEIKFFFSESVMLLYRVSLRIENLHVYLWCIIFRNGAEIEYKIAIVDHCTFYGVPYMALTKSLRIGRSHLSTIK